MDKDTDDDGTRDGAEQAGVVAKFEGGVLTIDLANGSSVSGLVTGDTEIECESEDQEEADHEDGPGARRDIGAGTTATRSGSPMRTRTGDEPGDDEGDDHSGPRRR